MFSRLILSAVIATFMSVHAAHADDITTLSASGYTCVAKMLIKGKKTIKPSTLITSLGKQITSLTAQLKIVKKTKNAVKIKKVSDALAKAKALKLSVSNCSKGKIPADHVDAIWTTIGGAYNGTYEDSNPSYAFLNGNLNATFDLHGTTFSVSITLGGIGPQYIFGSNDPVFMQTDVNNATYPVIMHGSGTAFGEVTLNILGDGSFHLSSTKPLNGGNVIMTLDGSFSSGNRYSGSYSIGTDAVPAAFVGSFSMTK